MFFSFSAAINCGDMISSNTVLDSDLICSGTALIIAANDVSLDCDGHIVNYANDEFGYGVNITNFNGTIIKNCNFIQNSSVQDSHAIFFENSTGGLVYNSNISTSSYNSYALLALFSSDLNLSYNIINTTYQAIYLNYLNNTKIYHNNISAYNSDGIHIDYGLGTDVIGNSVYSDQNKAFYLYYSSDTNISSNEFISSNSEVVYLYYDANTILVNNSIYSGNSDGLIINGEENLVVSNNLINASNNGNGIGLSNCQYCNFSYNSIYAYSRGFYLQYGNSIAVE